VEVDEEEIGVEVDNGVQETGVEVDDGVQEIVKARNDEWVGARPSVGSTVLLWMQDIAHPKGIATETRFL